MRKEIADSQHVIDVADLGEWEDRARAFLAEVKAGIDEINLAPETDDEQREAFGSPDLGGIIVKCSRRIVKSAAQGRWIWQSSGSVSR